MSVLKREIPHLPSARCMRVLCKSRRLFWAVHRLLLRLWFDWDSLLICLSCFLPHSQRCNTCYHTAQAHEEYRDSHDTQHTINTGEVYGAPVSISAVILEASWIRFFMLFSHQCFANVTVLPWFLPPLMAVFIVFQGMFNALEIVEFLDFFDAL